MINPNLKFMKSQEIKPHMFYFLDEDAYKENLISLKEKKCEFINISTIGIFEYDNNNEIWYLIYEKERLCLNIKRVDLTPIIGRDTLPIYFILYGELKFESTQTQPLLIVHFYRNVGLSVDFEVLKEITLKRRELINESLNSQDFLF